MKTLAHFLAGVAISICLSLLVQVQTASGDPPQQSAPKDSIKIQVESNPRPGDSNTFKLLPKYNQEKDTAGFKLIPKHYGDVASNFVSYDKEPQIVKKVEPVYPEAALRAGLEGRVIVKMWVDKDGKVKQVVVLKSDNKIFNQPAIAAGKQFVFTPAYLHNTPVALWVSYPFRFRLPDKK